MWLRRLFQVSVACCLSVLLVQEATGQSAVWEHKFQILGSCNPNDTGPPIIEMASAGGGYHFLNGPSNFYRSSDDGETWDKPSFQKFHIEGILPMQADTLLIGLYGNPGGVYRLTDYGEAWEQAGLTLNINELVATRDRSLIFAIPADSGLYLSTDKGDSWQNVQPSKTISFVRIGQHGAIYHNGGATFVSENGVDWTEHPSTRFPVTTSDPNVLLSNDQNGISRSTDDGRTWELVLAVDNPSVRLNNEGHPVSISKDGIVDISEDTGLTWSRLISTPPPCGLRSAITIDPEGHVWLGATNSGIFRSSETTHVSISPREQPARLDFADLYPNPISESGTIRFSRPAAGAFTVGVYDIVGRHVATLDSGHCTSLVCSFQWDAGSLSNGLYILQITDADGSRSQPVVVNR